MFILPLILLLIYIGSVSPAVVVVRDSPFAVAGYGEVCVYNHPRLSYLQLYTSCNRFYVLLILEATSAVLPLGLPHISSRISSPSLLHHCNAIPSPVRHDRLPPCPAAKPNSHPPPPIELSQIKNRRLRPTRV